MMIAHHVAEMCAASHDAVRDKYLPHMARLPEVSKNLGVNVEGSWTDMPAHTLYFVVDAPNAHAVTQLALELHLMDWNTVTVNPVISLQEATERASSRKI